jgi:ubiquinol-cytochrome c reductase cytochrome c subunit
VLLLIGLFLMGAAYSAVAPRPAEAGVVSQDDVSEGKQLFQANCASCHGLNAEGRQTGSGDAIAGPTLAGVGAAAVDFQMSTGRMPMRAPTAQAPRSDTIKFSEEDIAKISAYVASLAPGPAIPSEEMVDPTKGDPAKGGELFRVNCAMCHNSSGAGGALTRGKYAPSLMDVAPKDIYMAMETGPQSMPRLQRHQPRLDGQARHHRLPQERGGGWQPRRSLARSPGACDRGHVRLDLRPGPLGRDRRLARKEGRMTLVTDAHIHRTSTGSISR